jgi:hypothetical protein
VGLIPPRSDVRCGPTWSPEAKLCARRLRNRGIPARLDLSAEDMTVQSAAGALTLPWARTPVLYLQPQGAASCSMPAFDPDKRQVLFVDLPAERLRDVIMSHSGGRTVPRVVQAGQAAYGLRNLAQGAATVSRGRR